MVTPLTSSTSRVLIFHRFSGRFSSFEHPATLKSLSDLKLQMLLGRHTRSLQSLRFNEARLVKFSIEEESFEIAVQSKWSFHKCSIFVINSRTLLNFEQPKRIRTSRDSISNLLRRLLRLLQFSRSRKVNLLWTKIDGWTSHKFIQPLNTNILRLGTLVTLGVAMKFKELFNLMDFNLSQCC